MLEELEIHNLGPIRSALIAPAGGMTAITGETGAGKSMLLSAIRLISGGPSDGGRVSVGAQEAWAQGVFEVASSPAAVAAAREAGFEPEDGELFLSRKVPASGRSRSMLSGRSVPRSVLASVAAELVTIHGQADQLRIATTSRQREFLDRYAGDEVALAAYGKSWSALRAMDERLERLNSRNRPCDSRRIICANQSNASTVSTRSRGRWTNCVRAATASKTRPRSPKA